MPEQTRDRTQDLQKDDYIKYDTLEIQAKDHGWPHGVAGTQSSEIQFNAGTVKITRAWNGQRKYLPAELWQTGTEQKDTGEAQAKKGEEVETVPCWHPEQATCPWETVPYGERPFRNPRENEDEE